MPRLTKFTETVQVTYITETCCSCGVEFAMTQSFFAERQSDKDSFYCPNGHSQSYTGESYRKQIARLEAEKIALQSRIASTKAEAASEIAKAQAATKRMVKRAAATMCPFCHRTFATARMQRHLHTKHPEEAHK